MRLRLVLALALLGTPILTGAQQRDWSKVDVESTPLRMGTHLITGAGGNIVASVGDDGAFIIDDQYAPLNDRIRAALQAIGPQPVRFVINTHWHGDHTGGNEAFGSTGAVIMAHDNVRKRMSTQQFTASMQPRGEPSPAGALPVVTFTEAVTLHLNGDTVRVLHVADAHTDGDALVKFEKANVLHMGDTFFHGAYPFIDVASGGGIDGVLAAVRTGLGLADAETIVVPGHGKRADRAALVAYGELLQQFRDRIAAMKAEGLTLEQVIAANPTAATDEAMGQGFISPERLVQSIYESL